MGASGALWEMLYKQYADRPIHTRTDPKKRLTLPAKWRTSLGKKVWWLLMD